MTLRELARAPLTFGQLSLWRSVERLPPGQLVNTNVGYVWELPRGCTVEAVLNALDMLQERHESLRTGYVSSESDVTQVLWAASRAPVKVVDADGNGDDTAAVVSALTSQIFALDRERPWRCVVMTERGVPVRVCLSIHHIAADGAAADVLRGELVRLLAGESLEPVAVRCRDLAFEQRSERWRARRRSAVDYWERVIAAAVPPTPRPDGPTVVRWGSLTSVPALDAARDVAAAIRVSVHSVVLAAYVRALAQRFDSDRFLIGLMAGNRSDPVLSPLISSVNQLVPLLVRLDEDEYEDLPRLARRLHGESLVAYMHGCFDVDEVERVIGRFGYDSCAGIGMRFFFNFAPGVPYTTGNEAGSTDRESGDGWQVEVRANQRDNSFPVYLRAGDGGPLWCVLREAVPDTGAGSDEQHLARAVKEHLLSMHRILLGFGAPAGRSA